MEALSRPSTPHKLCEFFGLINLYNRFIPNCACILSPLLGKRQSRRDIHWTEEATNAFNSITETLVEVTLLFHPITSAPLSIATDASNTAVGAVLQQQVQGCWQPLAYFSRSLKPAERRYSTFDRELLGIYLAVKHFRFSVEGRQFHILTDHKPLTYVSSFHSSNHSPRRIRQFDYILQFTSDIRHVKGSANIAADALSRAAVDSICTNARAVMDFQELAQAQRTDTELAELMKCHSLVLRQTPLCDTIIRDMVTGVPLPFVPESLRYSVFTALHSLSLTRVSGHLNDYSLADSSGQESMLMSVDGLVNVCNVSEQKYRGIQLLLSLDFPNLNTDLHIDLVGPLPPSQGFTYLLTIVDRFTRWVKPFHWSISQQKRWLMHLFLIGFRVLEPLLLLQLIMEDSSNPLSGLM